MKEIRGDAKNISSLLSAAKFSIDYYQREYRWGKKQVTELIEDLAEKFGDSHDPSNERSAVESYGHYFLGSIIVSNKDGRKFIIDGQQRLTTLTLLLVHIHRQLKDDAQKAQLTNLIYSQKYGVRSFNIDVEERSACMNALFTSASFDDTDQPESVVNILNRYQDIEDLFPDDLTTALPFFADWLIFNVYLVEITAYSDTDAYTIFETMNDRGLSLTPTDMLKGYLLANITDPERRISASNLWRKRVSDLQDVGKEEDADAIKAWLRSQYARNTRERIRGAEPRDFDLIGTEFHRWVRDNVELLQLASSTDFGRFIEQDFEFYTRWYVRIRKAAESLTDGLEAVHFCAQNNFTLQYPVLLAPLRRDDTEQEIRRKLRVVSAYLDILVARRVWNWRAINYSTMQYAMFLVMRDIRGKSVAELVPLLNKRLESEPDTFFSFNDRFRLHGTNGRQIHRLLARLTNHLETQSGRPSHYHDYVSRQGKDRYEVEHIWANHPERHRDEFSHPVDFDEYRNRIGGLLLMPKSFNQAFGDMTYNRKRKHYLKQNLLAQSLHEDAYERDPGFKKFIDRSGLPFKPHEQFKKADLDARQKLYQLLAEQIWSPNRLANEAES